MKRIALLVTALLLLAMFAVACGGTTEQTVDEAANAAATTVDEAANGAMDNANEAMDNANEAMDNANEAMDNANEAMDNANEATGETTGGEDCKDADVLCIGLVTDVGEVDDKSFNQSAWEGAQQAAEDLGAADVNYVETKDAKDYGANIDLFATQGYDIIVTVGFAMGEATIAAAETYPDIYFIGVDQFQGATVPNLAGLVFNEDQAGYLAGVLAASMSESGTIASVLGTDLVPPVVAYNEGYKNGAMSVNPDIKVIDTYHPGGLDVAFTDPEWGASTAQQAIDQGADVVFGAGGKTGNGALIQTAGNKDLWCIGVDSDQWDTVPEAHPCLISSAMKLITPGVVELATMAMDGQFPGGNYFGAVGLAPFHDHEDAVPQDVKDLLMTTEAGLKDGSISAGYTPGG